MIDHKQIAAEIFLNKSQDIAQTVLHILTLTQGNDFEQIYEIYNKLITGETKIITILYGSEKDIADKKTLQSNIETLANNMADTKQPDYIFVYKPETKLIRGIRVQIGDVVFDNSLEEAINKL